jgi:hypothetical protein
VTAIERPRASLSPLAGNSQLVPLQGFPPGRDEAGWTGTDTAVMSGAALSPGEPRRVRLLLAQCAETKPRRPVLERLREKVGVELARVLVLALAGSCQRRSARRG